MRLSAVVARGVTVVAIDRNLSLYEDAIVFLASPESSYITGAEHLVDAGMLAH